MKTRLIILLFASVTMIISCSKSSGTGGTTGGGGVNCSTIANKTFSADVNPIIQSRCAIASCHAAGSLNGPGPLTNYSQIFAARSSIRAAVSSGLMPQGSTLSSNEKNSITCWIDSGAPNN